MGATGARLEHRAERTAIDGGILRLPRRSRRSPSEALKVCVDRVLLSRFSSSLSLARWSSAMLRYASVMLTPLAAHRSLHAYRYSRLNCFVLVYYCAKCNCMNYLLPVCKVFTFQPTSNSWASGTRQRQKEMNGCALAKVQGKKNCVKCLVTSEQELRSSIK